MDRCFRGASIVYGYSDKQIVSGCFCILHKDVEVAIVVKDPRVDKVVLGLEFVAFFVFFYELLIWKFRLRILVQHLHIGMCRRAVEVIVMLLAVFAVIPLNAGQSKDPLLKDRIFGVPERDREVRKLIFVADACDTLFAPPVGFAARSVVRDVLPCITMMAVILANSSPLTFREIRSKLSPVLLFIPVLDQTLFFFRHIHLASESAETS